MKLAFCHSFHLLAMNFHSKSLSLFFLLLLALGGCVNELVPTTNGYKPAVVVWAILSADSTIDVITSGNRGLEITDVVNLSNVNMYIYDNGVLADTKLSASITSDTITHRFNIKPESNHTYTLKILTKDKEISASVELPFPLTKPDDIKLSQGVSAQLEYTISDDINFEDAYQFDVIVHYFGVLTDTSNNSVIQSNYSFTKKYDKYDEPSLNYNLLGLNNLTLSNYTFPVSDNLFNGKQKTFLFNVQNQVSDLYFIPRNIIKGPPVSDLFKSKRQFVFIKCRKITAEYYKFFVSENKNNAIFGTPYYNPTNVYSNISGGLGLMAGMNERYDTVWIRK